jgi:hypothetical protein
MIATMARHSHDPIAKFIRWLNDARRERIPNYETVKRRPLILGDAFRKAQGWQ